MDKMIEMKLNDICEIKDKMIDALKSELSRGVESVDTKEAGEVADIIKDLAEAERNCREAEYYKSVTEAMEEGSKEDQMYGYSRSPRMGHTLQHFEQKPYLDEYLHGENMRYGYSESGRSGNYSGQNSSYGNSGRSGFVMDEHYSEPYNEFRRARRNYTESNSMKDKEHMELYASESVMDTIATIRDIYRSSTPELKKKIKDDLTKLIGEM